MRIRIRFQQRGQCRTVGLPMIPQSLEGERLTAAQADVIRLFGITENEFSAACTTDGTGRRYCAVKFSGGTV
jgi:hypothetical protein